MMGLLPALTPETSPQRSRKVELVLPPDHR
jgi:hypothetical protein